MRLGRRRRVVRHQEILTIRDPAEAAREAQFRARQWAAHLQFFLKGPTFTEELMNRHHVYGLTAAFAIAACSAVQIEASQDTATSASAKNETVVTGCLVSGDERGTTGATGTSGVAGATTTAAHFKLTDAIVSAAGSGASTGSDMGSTSGAGSTTTGASASATHPSFVLLGKESDLKDNLNSRVEVRGTIQPNTFSSYPAGSAAGGATTGGATATGSGVGTTGTGSSVTASASAQTLRVTSVKKIAGSCTR